ncbi:MAG: hypothetical protein UZ15_CFX003000807 [Chloroflexi bacterium OLB15]|nr:MAG: hypothetical protein UZ15_CFX003000807 [Chloroflexi bacterium OLB15]
MSIQLKRAYVAASADDGYRVLVDRLWPRGISKEQAKVDLWLKEIAPSNDLRKWFEHDPAKWGEFKKRYGQELDSHPDLVKQLADLVKARKVTLVYGAKNEEFNQAVALKEYLNSAYSGG